MLLTLTAKSQSYGLGFLSHDVVADQRTSLDLFPKRGYASSGNFKISFEMSFLPDMGDYYGYIFRIVENGQRNIDLIHNQRNFGIDASPSDKNHFKLVINDHFTHIAFSIDEPKLLNQWNKFTLLFDYEQDRLILEVNGHKYTEYKVHLNKVSLYKIFFGINNYLNYSTNDCPPFKVRNIRILNDEKVSYFWPLNETKGNLAHEIIEGQNGQVTNPLWIRSMHHNWTPLQNITVKGAASVAYNAKEDLLYIVGADSLVVYAIKDGKINSIPYSSGRLKLLPSNQSIYNDNSHTLYNFYIEDKYKQITTFNFGLKKWNTSYPPPSLSIDYWHANNFFSVVDSSLYIIGGYGQLTYKNTINRYHIPNQSWNSITAKGDYFCPRYLAAAGTADSGKTAYLLGGYGSYKGQQMLNPQNQYDLMRFDVKTKIFKKIYDLKVHQKDCVFANSLVINSKKRTFNALIFSNHHYNSHLELIEGNLDHPDYKIVGDSIPYAFHDTHSFANLYFSPLSQKLIAVTLLRSEKNNQTTVKLYSLLYPPDSTIENKSLAAKDGKQPIWIYFVIVPIGFITIVLMILYKKRQASVTKLRKTITEEHSVPMHTENPLATTYSFEHPVTEEKQGSAIFLFGDLQLFNAEGEDIIKNFTSLLKELFLVILIYSLRSGRGISPEKLIELLWFDKSEESAKNNRSANLSKLKGLLQQVGNIHLSKDTGKWKIDLDHTRIYVDYYEYLQIVANQKTLNKDSIAHLIEIVHRGGFLSNIEYPWLDPIKSEISNEIVDIALAYASKINMEENAEFLIKLANCIFVFDSVSEEAMIIKCRSLVFLGKHSLAKSTYESFLKEYKLIYDEDFKKNFHMILENQ
jgi:DNA-binding SARP family transcriptional activator